MKKISIKEWVKDNVNIWDLVDDYDGSEDLLERFRSDYKAGKVDSGQKETEKKS